MQAKIELINSQQLEKMIKTVERVMDSEGLNALEKQLLLSALLERANKHQQRTASKDLMHDLIPDQFKELFGGKDDSINN